MPLLPVELKTHPLSGVSLIEASAGTGKTYTIAHLYVRCLLETELGVEQMLVVTFTNAATQELKGRIRQLIYDVWKYLQDVNISNSQFDTLFADHRQQQHAQFKLHKALINFDEAAIYSIHGFCQRILNIFPVETNALIQQQIIADEKELLSSAIRDYWRQHITGCDINELSWISSQWDHPDSLLDALRPLLGFEQAIQQTLQGLQLESMTTQLKTLWQQLNQRWQSHSDELQDFLLNSTALNRKKVQPKTAARLIGEWQAILSETLPYTLPAKWELFTRQKLAGCIKKNETDERLYSPFFDITQEFERLHEQWINTKKTSLLLRAAQTVQQTVNESKATARNISFDDLISRVSGALTLENRSLINRINTLYPLAMVDEFQDTDHKQYHIFNMLYQQDDDKTLILIGDPKQAIYSFRGADVFTYQQAKQSTQNHYSLEINYRSSEPYIKLLNGVFSYNPDAFIYHQLMDFHSSKADIDREKIITQQGEAVASLVSWIHPYSSKPISKNQATDYFASLCASEIQQILQHKSLQLDGQDVCAQDLAILVKTGRQASLMKKKLAQLGISSALILRDSVFSSVQAAEISLLLEVLIEPDNISRLCGLLTTDLFGWNARQIEQLQQDDQQLVTLLQQVKEYQLHWQQKGILSMFFSLLQRQQTLQKNARHMEGERRMTNWLHVMELLQQQSSQHASHTQTLHWLLQQRERSGQQGENEEHQMRLESDSNLVRIVTIHKSKGLQYPIVFLPFMWYVKSGRNQPASYSVHDEQGHKKLMILDETLRERWREENLAEETRLFYVAMTRAIYRCYIGWGNINEAGSSSIAHCLYPEQIDRSKYPHQLDLADAQKLREPFVTLAQQNAIDIVEKEAIDTPGTIPVTSVAQRPTARKFERILQQQWRISSYSQMASTGVSSNFDRPDYDSVAVTTTDEDSTAEQDELTRFNFAKGAKAGNFLHDILELQLFDQPIDRLLLQHKCQQYGYEEKWIPCLTQWIQDILACSLGPLRLNELSARNRLSEMEFYLSSNSLQCDVLNRLLFEQGYTRNEQAFSFATINGFLSGFIDLVFERAGQYFIADYKSNYLGPTAEHYTDEHCRLAMFDHHYHLQYLIYSLALHRYLQTRIQDYDYEQHFGGVYYLFLRGMSRASGQQYGVFFHKPPYPVIQQLDQLLGVVA